MGFNLVTQKGHNMFDMSSMLQKAIRRKDYTRAGYAANELYLSFPKYFWKRMLVISAEDCYGTVTKEIIALKIADDEVNAKKKADDKDLIFAAKAVTLLCTAPKSRDACYFACNFMWTDNLLNEDEIEHIDIEKCNLGVEKIPDYVFDVHTYRGKKMGKTDLDMIADEEAALEPKQISLFDNGDWSQYFDRVDRRGNMCAKDQERYPEWKKTRVHYE